MKDEKMERIIHKSFFKHAPAILKELMDDLHRVRIDGKPLSTDVVRETIIDLCDWLGTPLNSTTYRANKHYTDAVELGALLANALQPPPPPSRIKIFRELETVIVDGRKGENNEGSRDIEEAPCSTHVTVDTACGSAVLKGAHVFAPGIMSIPSGVKAGDTVSVFADTSANCKKGAKRYDDPDKLFLGNGILRQTRSMLFGASETVSPATGIAVEMRFVVSGIRQLEDASVPTNLMVLQNPPSLIAVLLLDPQPGQRILDMCAAPGNKTTHISSLMNGEGSLVALEKIKSKIPRLRKNCEKFGCENVAIHCFDATAAAAVTTESSRPDEPPFPQSNFDRILLDGPCSSLGQRPQLLNRITPKELRSYVPLQRKLIATAAQLLKVGGILVYSTCTVTIAENEGIIAWALKNIPCLKLSTTTSSLVESLGLEKKYCGAQGYCIDGLTEEDSSHLLRFGPGCDTIGFFIARFVKTDGLPVQSV